MKSAPLRAIGLSAAALVALGVALGTAQRFILDAMPMPLPVALPRAPGAPHADERGNEADPAGETADDDEDRSFVFRVPSGEPSAVSCDDARRIVLQVRRGLAYPPEPVKAQALAESTADWLDPQGLWAAPEDAPTAGAIARRAAALLAELDDDRTDACPAARAIGAVLGQWVDDLRATFDAARAEALAQGAAVRVVPADAVGEPIRALESGSGRHFARELGRRVAAFELAVGDAGARRYVDAARRHFFPPLDADGWARVVLAGAVRAYVPLVDPHSAWAPLDEESSVYEVDLAAHPPAHWWDGAAATALGVRIVDGAVAPLRDGDVVLAIGDTALAGLPSEQVDQLAFTSGDRRDPTTAVVARAGEEALRSVVLAAPPDAPGDRGGAPAPDLPVDRVAFGDGDVLVVAIADVRDDLGDELTRALHRGEGDAGATARVRDRGRDHDVDRDRERDPLFSDRPIVGVVLDLRGNGGGSTDGATAALGLFLSGAPLFPLKRRDGTIEAERAPEPPNIDRWPGPVATLVDASTASAAEMIAGALAVYRRGPSLGTVTYGKGCAQEYVDDDAHAGVLRLTTLLYALPDGTPVQRVGLAPTFRVPFAGDAHDATPPITSRGVPKSEREADLPHAPPTWRGPDLRDPTATSGGWEVAWPSAAGHVGPCKDADVCRALRVLGGTHPRNARR